MAYEVARVHGLIMSNIQDGGEKDPAETWPMTKSVFQMPPRMSPDTPLLYDFPSDTNQWSESSHSSCLESSTETETESDEDDDFIAGLAEQIAHSMLDDDETSNATGVEDNFPVTASSDVPLSYARTDVAPQKVVSPQSSWSPTSLSASWTDSVPSSKHSSQVSSPPSTPFNSEGDAWDLLNAAAGEVGRLKMNEDRKPAQKQVKSPVSVVPEIAKQCARAPQQPTAWRTLPHLVQLSTPSNCNVGSRPSGPAPSSRDRMPAGAPHSNVQKSWSRPREEERKTSNNGLQQQRLPRNEGVAWNQRRQPNPYKGGINQKGGRQNYSYAHRTTGKPIDALGVPQRPVGQGVNGGSGMRAVFLGSAGSGRESGGTGVFLPRCVGSGSEQRRKPSCSTVLLPSRIVQVLNLNVEDMRTHPAPLPVTTTYGRNDYSSTLRNPPPMYMMELSAGAMKYEGANAPSYPRKLQGPHAVQSEAVEFGLPTEWTY
ncbi:unnamed protein product [Calypogeia fissa]